MKILSASPGCVYTDGETYGGTVCLPDNADTSSWHEISLERAEAMQAAKVAAMDAEAQEAERCSDS